MSVCKANTVLMLSACVVYASWKHIFYFAFMSREQGASISHGKKGKGGDVIQVSLSAAE